LSDAYSPRGRVGLLVPQANAVAEAEAAILLPPGIGLATARLVSGCAAMEARLAEYFDAIGETAARFGGMPLSAIGFACTGASYPFAPADEDARIAAVSARLGVPVVTAAQAVCAALQALGARRVALVSPYSDVLTRASEGYWRARGFELGQVARVTAAAGEAAAPGAHPIYALGDAALRRALDAVDGGSVDAVVVLGTGLASLPAIAATPRVGGAPVLSCMLALTWACVERVGGGLATPAAGPGGDADAACASIRRWIVGDDWRAPLRARIVGQGVPMRDPPAR
jgi:maleate isomerase